MSMLDKTLDTAIGIIVVFFVLAGLATTIIASANNISASGLPLATLFGASGVLLILFMIGVFVKLVKLSK